MKKQSPKRTVVLTIITAGLYSLVWFSRSKTVLVSKGYQLPSLWFFIVPFGSYWWVWSYSKAVEGYSGSEIKGNDTFLLYLIATMAGGFGFSISDDFLPDLTVALILAGIGIFISLVIYSIFFYVMQSKYNKLSTSV